MPISRYIQDLRRLIGTRCIMMPSVSAIVVNEAGQVLLHRSTHDGNWYVIGGAPDPGEDLADAAVREALEETGLRVLPERLVGVYTDPLVRYSNGDEVLYVATVFRCKPVGGTLKIGDDESLEVRYFPPGELPPLLSTHKLRVEHTLGASTRAAFRFQGRWVR